MCNTCGCNLTDANRHLVEPGGELAPTGSERGAVEVLEGLLGENDRQAAHNREHFGASGVVAINLMSSPGSGKTRLLEATIQALGGSLKIAVIEGDLETENDAERIRRQGVPAIQITTGNACHLDAHMLHEALHHLPLDGLDLLFIENVGNLVCPAGFDLGQHHNIILLSVTEGDDKPDKYPVMFRAADLLLITKSDLLPHLDAFDPARAETGMRNLASQAPVWTLSASSGEGMERWIEWLRTQVEQQRARRAAEPHASHSHAHAHP